MTMFVDVIVPRGSALQKDERIIEIKASAWEVDLFFMMFPSIV